MNLIFFAAFLLSLWPDLAISDDSLHRSRRTRSSPAVEITMHLPSPFSDIDSFRSYLGIKPERRRRDVEVFSRHKREIQSDDQFPDKKDKSEVQGQLEPVPEEQIIRTEREAFAEPIRVDSSPLMVESSPFIPMGRQYPDAVLELVDRGEGYKSLSSGEPDDPRKRRNTSANDHEDKRAYPEPGRNQDGTTAPPFWKQQSKKNSPPFITAREGRQNFDQAQHRNMENSRESHSLKDGKTIASNEIPRMSDSYYSASDSTARAYTPRQGEAPAPKSVYDTIDYSSRRAQSRNVDTRGRLTSDVYNRPYDRYYYSLGSEVAGRGVEYYHRSLDPGTGRVIYYASLPEPDVYRATRTYAYDSFGRSFPPAAYSPYPNYPYPSYNPYFPYQQYNSQDFSRSARYQQPQGRLDRDESKNKTYVIFDADERRPLTSPPPYIEDRNSFRFAPPLPYPSFQPTYYPGYQPYPSGYTPYNSYSRDGYQQQRGLVSRHVDLPLSSRSSLKPVTT